MTTLRQIEANRLNAQKSTGPKTPEGKNHSRRSALKHGLAGKDLVMPDEAEEHTAKRLETWSKEFAPKTDLERWLVERIVMESIRIDLCKSQLNAFLADHSYRAECFWEEDRRLDAEKLARRLPKDPGMVRIQLESTKQGCELILERWELLLAALEPGKPWNDVLRAMALDLLGVHPDLRGPHSRIDPKKPEDDVVEHQSNVARGQIERLTERITCLDVEDSGERDLAMAGLDFPHANVTFRLLHRYNSEAHRRMDRAMERLQASRRRPKDSPTTLRYHEYNISSSHDSPAPRHPEAENRKPPKKMSPEAEHAVHPDTPLTTREAFFEALGPDYDIDRAMAKVVSAGKWDEWFVEPLKPRYNGSAIKPPPHITEPVVRGVHRKIIQAPDLFNLPIQGNLLRRDEPKRP